MAVEAENVVEATSLSDLLAIASDPPSDPLNPNSLPLEPITLYIAKVPGRRDVFLTPFKPREKVVSAQDVQSSLYYVHVHAQNDIDDFNDFRSGTRVDRESNVAPDLEVLNRPVLPPRPTVINDQPVAEAGSVSSAIRRKPVGGNQPSKLPSSSPSSDPPRLPPRPLPPLPGENDQGLLPFPNGTTTVRVPSHPQQDEWAGPNMRGQAMHGILPDAPETGSLTLIRRDPASSEQWNVATIRESLITEADKQARTRFNKMSRPTKERACFDLTICNPSYSRFMEKSARQAQISSTAAGTSHEIDVLSNQDFQRMLQIPAPSPHIPDHRDHDRVKENDLFRSGHESSGLQTIKRRSIQLGNTFSRQSASDRINRNYTFQSPWGSLCEFAVGTLGNSLRCRHYLRADTQAEAIELSELRFNLPGTAQSHIGHDMSKRSARPNSSHETQWSRLSLDEDGESHMSIVDRNGWSGLALGREKAGGGFGGKKAKLGKLIVRPEGMKMLDLLVAANIALWWRAYTKE